MKTKREQLEILVAEMRQFANAVEAKGRPSVADTKKLDEMGAEVSKLAEEVKGGRWADLTPEQLVDAMAKPQGGDVLEGAASGKPHGRKAWGETVVRATMDEWAEVKALTSGSVVVPSLSTTIVTNPQRPRRLLEIVGFETLQGTDTYSYLQETVRTNNAAPVAVGGMKPTSVYTVARVDDTVQTIAHLSEPIPRQTLADATLLRQYVEGSLREGVELALENQVLNGDGDGANLTGIANVANIQTQAFATNMLVTARQGLLQLEEDNFDTAECVFVLAPADWATIELMRESTDGGFLNGDPAPPVDRVQRRLWGVRVVTSTLLTAGTAYLVHTPSVKGWERESVQVDWSENTYDPDALGSGVGASDFQRNMIRFRAEGRWGFAALRPTGIVELDMAA